MKQLAHFAIGLIAMGSLAACGGGDSSPPPVSGGPIIGVTPPAPPPVLATELETDLKAMKFLQRSGLGATTSEVDALVGTDAAEWVQAQLTLPATGYEAQIQRALPRADAKNRDNSQLIWQTMFETEAELRTRMTYALSQITVIGDQSFFNDGYGLAAWLDTLDHNAFGNYRDLLQDVTYSPLMGRYLTYLYNRKGDARTGRQPDENYAREVLQLFTIGLVELNMDGTPKLGSNGQPIETYDNEDVVGLARVFTGFVLQGTSHRYRDRADNAQEVPMMLYEPNHSELEKSFLGTTIPANTPAAQSIDQALDTIFAHPNVAPFISRQLIQRFTASHPSPAYVERVANVFETGRMTSPSGTSFGTGQRGDLSATIAAVLLDESLYDEVQDTNEGKVREPVLKFVQFARAYAKSGTTQVMTGSNNHFRNTSDPNSRLGQAPLRSPSVFNFYRPGFIAPNTETGAMDLTAPELQIVNQSSTFGYIEFLYRYLTRTDGGNHNGLIVPDFSAELAVADDAQALFELLNVKLTGGRMSATTQANMIDMLNAYPIREDSRDADLNTRVLLAMVMGLTSPAYGAF